MLSSPGAVEGGGTRALAIVPLLPVGVACYGFTPLLATRGEIAATHDRDQRVPENTVRRSKGILCEVVLEPAHGWKGAKKPR